MVLARCKLYLPTVPALAEPSPLLPFQDAVESPSSSRPQSQVPRNYKDVFRPPSFLLLFLYLSHPTGIFGSLSSPPFNSKTIIPGEWFLGKPWSSLCLLFSSTNWVYFKWCLNGWILKKGNQLSATNLPWPETKACTHLDVPFGKIFKVCKFDQGWIIDLLILRANTFEENTHSTCQVM